jgi:hypothetical protein
VQARPVGEAERFWRWCLRNRLAAALAATVFLMITTIAIGATVMAYESDKEKAETARALSDTKKALFNEMVAVKDKTVALKKMADALKKEAETAQSLRLEKGRQSVGMGLRLLEDDPLGALVWLTRALENDPDDTMNRRRVADMFRRYPLRQLWVDADRAWFSGDSKRLLTVSGSGLARVWDSQSGNPVTPAINHAGRCFWGSFSADGRWAATTSRLSSGHTSEVRVWDAANGKLRFPPFQHEAQPLHVFFSPDDRLLLTANFPEGLYELRDAHTGKVV